MARGYVNKAALEREQLDVQASSNALDNATQRRGQDLTMQKAGMDDITTQRGQNFGLMGDLSRPRSSGLEGLSSALEGMGGSTDEPSGLLGGSSVPPGIRFGSGASASTILSERGIGATGTPAGLIPNPGGSSLPPIPGATTGYKPMSYKTGGLIDGPPPPPDGSDNVDIKAKAGEYVLPPEAVQLLGLETLDRIVQMSTGHPPVHGGTPTEEGKMGFQWGGATEMRQAMQAADRATPNATPTFWNPGAKPGAGLEAVEPPAKPLVRINEPVSAEGLASGMSVPLPRLSAPNTRPDAAASWAVRRGTRPPAPLSAGAEKAQQAAKATNQAAPQSPPVTSTLSRTSAPSGVNSPAHPEARRVAEMMTEVNAPSDNVQGTGIYGKDSAGTNQQIYINRFEKGTPEYAKYGAAIISDSQRGATQRGFDQDYAETGNYVGDPATGKGMSLPPTAGQRGRMGLGELSPKETQAVMMGYGPARQAGLQAMRDNANLDVMRQWQGQDLSRAPQEVRGLYGKKPAGLEAMVEQNIADTLSPEGQAQQRQYETTLAALKTAGRAKSSGAKGNEYTKALASTFKDYFGEQANDSMMTTMLELAPWIQQYEPDPGRGAALLYQATRGMQSSDTIRSASDEAGQQGWFRSDDGRAQQSRAEYDRLMQMNPAQVRTNLELLLQGRSPMMPQ